MNYEKPNMKSRHSSFIFHSSSFSSGFTLIEILLVVVIILIAASVAVPKLGSSLSSTRMKDAVRATIRITNYARSMSILRQADCTLSFTEDKMRLSSRSETLVERRLPDEVEISEFENLTEPGNMERQVIYYSSGMNDGFELTLSDSKNRRHTIRCNAVTGKVTVDE